MRAPEIKVLVDNLTERVNNLSQKLSELEVEHKRTLQTLNDLRRESEKDGIVAKKEIEDVKKWKDEQKKERDERARRLWAFGPNISAAMITIVLAPVVVLLWNWILSKMR